MSDRRVLPAPFYGAASDLNAKAATFGPELIGISYLLYWGGDALDMQTAQRRLEDARAALDVIDASLRRAEATLTGCPKLVRFRREPLLSP